jgi:hypothetical protein
MEDFDPIEFARASALEAWDQRNDVAYGGFGKAIMAYMINVRDTLSEYNRLDALDQAVVTFCSVVGGFK